MPAPIGGYNRAMSDHSLLFADQHIDEDVLNNILIDLNDANGRQLEEIDNNCITLSKFRSPPAVVQNVITICHFFRVDHSVKYTAIELFDRLVVQLVCDTKRVFLATRELPDSSPLNWSEIEAKLKKQMHLRAVTCVWIAHKLLNAKPEVLTLVGIQKFLRDCGRKFSLQNLNRSELRVLKLLNFKLSANPVDIYVDTLLAVLKHNIPGFETCWLTFQEVSISLIDLYYICRYMITRNAFKLTVKRLKLDLNANEEELEMERIGANKMLTSCAIIATIPLVIDISIYERILNELSEISAIDSQLIVDMSRAILFLICDH